MLCFEHWSDFVIWKYSIILLFLCWNHTKTITADCSGFNHESAHSTTLSSSCRTCQSNNLRPSSSPWRIMEEHFFHRCSFLHVCVSVFQSSVVVEVPSYNKKTKDPVQVQFYVSNGKRRRSLTQSFTYLPAVRLHPPAAAGVKQECWEADHISHNPPGFCPTSCQVPSHDRVPGPDAVYYDSCDIPVHCGPPSQTTSRLRHAPPSLVFPHTSSIPLHTSSSSSCSSMPSQIPAVPHQTSIPLQTPIVSPQIPAMPPQASSVPLQTFSIPPPASSGGPQREPPPSLSSGRAFVAPADPQKDHLPIGPGEVASIKQEPEEALGLQEITLDDGRRLICSHRAVGLTQYLLIVSINLDQW